MTWASLGRLGHKIGSGVATVAGGIATGLGVAGAGIAATGIGAPIGAGVEALAGIAGGVALGGKAMDMASFGADALGKK